MKMRIVGINVKVFIQIMNNNKWEQSCINKSEFENLMKNEFSNYVVEYEKSNTSYDMANFFYNYGETQAMKRKGEAYIFKSK